MSQRADVSAPPERRRFRSWRHRVAVAAPCLLLMLASLMALLEGTPGVDVVGAAFAAVCGVLTIRALRLGVVVSDEAITDHALLWTPRYQLGEVERIRSESFDWYRMTPSGPSRKNRQAVLHLSRGRQRRIRSLALGGRRTADLVNHVFDGHIAPRGPRAGRRQGRSAEQPRGRR